MTGPTFTVEGYELAADRRYDPDANLWVAEYAPGRVRIGYDPLGAEITGDVVSISFVEVGSTIRRGEPLATVEAAKFVGPLNAPVGGVVVAVNTWLLGSPGAINVDPFGAWLVELGRAAPVELDLLLAGEVAVTSWFTSAVRRFREQGALAE